MPSFPPIGKLAAGARVTVKLTPSATCSARIALAVTASEAKRLKLGSKIVTLGTSRTTVLPAGRATSVAVVLAKRYRAKLRSARRLNARLVVVCADGAGSTFTGELAACIRR